MAAKKATARGMAARLVNLSGHFNYPTGKAPSADKYEQYLRSQVAKYPGGRFTSWGVPFDGAGPRGKRVIRVNKDSPSVTVRLSGRANYLCLLHVWEQRAETARPDCPREGMVVAQYEIRYSDGTKHIQPVRARFEVLMTGEESPGPAWLALPYDMWETIDPAGPPPGANWGRMQMGVHPGRWFPVSRPLHYALPNPHPNKPLKSLTIRGLDESSFLVAGLTLYTGGSHPLRHLPRRAYRVAVAGKTAEVRNTRVDLGIVVNVEKALPPRDKNWLKNPGVPEPADFKGGNVLHLTGSEDATVRVRLKHGPREIDREFSLGEAFGMGRSASGPAMLETLGRRRQWMTIRVIDGATGRPTPARIHFSGPHGNYIAPYGHHERVNPNWFEDYGADVIWSGRSFAYVTGEFATDLPIGGVYVEISKGFEYAPVRRKLTITPGRKQLDLRIDRWTDLRKTGWITADTHVHFISPHTAWLEGQAEGVNVVNLLASQWGRLFTNVGDYTGRVGVVENDTIVYVGTENRNHMLGHMSMLGTRGGLPVYPMCCGGPTESWAGDPDLMMLADWARENREKGGVVIRPHYPFCGHTEDPVPIIQGLVDALEIDPAHDFPIPEWYRYLNNGYRVAICGGTDKMSATCALGWKRTYALTDPNRPFNYDTWAAAVRAGRTFATSGPLMGLTVDGKNTGDTIKMTSSGGTVEVHAWAESFHPLGRLELVRNGQVVAEATAKTGARRLEIRHRVSICGSGWVAARCRGLLSHAEAKHKAAHTSPVYIQCGRTRAFDGPAIRHMLSLVSGGMEYMRTIATAYDESARKRIISQFKQAQMDLKARLVVEGH